VSDFLDTIEIDPEQPTASVIWLHGLGADGRGFEGIVAMLELPWVRFVLPHADHRSITLYDRCVVRGWYDIRCHDYSGDRECEADIRTSQAQIEALIRRENERGIPSERIVLAGFSQGGAMALHVGLRWPEPLAAVVVLSAYRLMSGSPAAERSPSDSSTPILFCHGTDDPVVPIGLGKAAYDQLAALDADREMEWCEYPMVHVVCPEEIAEIRRFLHLRIPGE
jgi:phospholipase/carboxylesterase